MFVDYPVLSDWRAPIFACGYGAVGGRRRVGPPAGGWLPRAAFAQAAAAACRSRSPCRTLLARAYQVRTMAALARPRTVSCTRPHCRNRALMHSWIERLR